MNFPKEDMNEKDVINLLLINKILFQLSFVGREKLYNCSTRKRYSRENIFNI